MFRTAVSVWTATIATKLSKHEASLSLADLTDRADLLLAGLRLAHQAADSARTCLGLHSSLNQPMTKTLVLAAASLIMDVKMVRETFTKYATTVAVTAASAVQHSQFQVLSVVQQVSALPRMFLPTRKAGY